jgi:hypothetical protein
MEITNSTPRLHRTVRTVPLAMPVVYAAGHELNHFEASALTQTLHEALRNNFAPRVKKHFQDLEAWDDSVGADGAPTRPLAPHEHQALQKEFDAYAEDYCSHPFDGMKSRGFRGDPVEEKSNELMLPFIKDALRRKNIKLSTISKKHMDSLVADALKKNPHVTEHARKLVEAHRTVAEGMEVQVGVE